MSNVNHSLILQSLQPTVDKLTREFNQIPDDRKVILKQLTDFVKTRTKEGSSVLLNFICTHNSRRSHISQIWGQAAAYYYGVYNVETFSGGTEATAFNPRAVSAMKQAGFGITTIKEGTNPVYKVK